MCAFLYTEINGPSGGVILCSLNNKKQMKAAMEKFEARFKPTPEYNFHVFQWNVAELPLPNPEDVQIDASGGTIEERALAIDRFSRWAFPTAFFWGVNTLSVAFPLASCRPRPPGVHLAEQRAVQA